MAAGLRAIAGERLGDPDNPGTWLAGNLRLVRHLPPDLPILSAFDLSTLQVAASVDGLSHPTVDASIAKIALTVDSLEEGLSTESEMLQMNPCEDFLGSGSHLTSAAHAEMSGQSMVFVLPDFMFGISRPETAKTLQSLSRTASQSLLFGVAYIVNFSLWQRYFCSQSALWKDFERCSSRTNDYPRCRLAPKRETSAECHTRAPGVAAPARRVPGPNRKAPQQPASISYYGLRDLGQYANDSILRIEGDEIIAKPDALVEARRARAGFENQGSLEVRTAWLVAWLVLKNTHMIGRDLMADLESTACVPQSICLFRIRFTASVSRSLFGPCCHANLYRPRRALQGKHSYTADSPHPHQCWSSAYHWIRKLIQYQNAKSHLGVAVNHTTLAPIHARPENAHHGASVIDLSLTALVKIEEVVDLMDENINDVVPQLEHGHMAGEHPEMNQNQLFGFGLLQGVGQRCSALRGLPDKKITMNKHGRLFAKGAVQDLDGTSDRSIEHINQSLGVQTICLEFRDVRAQNELTKRNTT
ncbi:hypothetical protein J7T55_003930 [Diaporthe amygdali]|uniref:uncharacterized protein n=1 Tax=Phomopsis amygdali TaxID=1214568 RepID=UPI0022FEC39C|nr:uncharacterized protein J7T55_003930 [Diaporthe amygdali]KAJ0117513.1 hypothetical protein J7T55_003930 [Diaporthe amygdali]